ncbi:MAG TPA: NAD-binding protein [Candidatus Binatia bacterium]|nr:NAD-binding protein [Candidatus Binatia bacterium]
MAHRYANGWSEAAAGLTALAHTRASAFRWGVVILLTLIWIGGGVYYWLMQGEDVAQAIYLTLSAVGMWDAYFDADAVAPGVQLDPMLQLVRFAAIATPAVGLLFAFSGQLGRSLARIFNLGAAHHIVIAGDSPAALSLALDCRRGKDSVILIAEELPQETALGLRRSGVTVLEGNATHIDTLRTARAHHAAHVVAFEPDDTANLQTEAAVRRLVGNARRRPPIGVHVATRSPMLLKEAREMRSAEMRKKRNTAPPIDPKPFSLEEMGARALLQQESQTLLSLAKQLSQDRVHIVFFGFDAGAEAVAERVLMSLWSAHFEPPRLTVLAPNPEAAEAGFRARHREAFAHPELWTADIAFLPFDWDAASVGPEVLDMVEQQRGKPTGIVVSTGADPGNIHLAIALKRACNHGYRWPVPIYMRESSQSEFSQQYARGDETEELDAYLQAFGAHQVDATRARIIDGDLDRGAAVAHEHYNKGLGKKDFMSMKELQAAMRDWSDVLETYRAANRAVADAAMVKVWDAGWRAAHKNERGDNSPAAPTEMMETMAQREHDRWVAERLMSGWRPTAPGEARNNDLMAHDKLAPWSAMTEADKNNDVVQVRAAMDVARMMHKDGFVKR